MSTLISYLAMALVFGACVLGLRWMDRRSKRQNVTDAKDEATSRANHPTARRRAKAARSAEVAASDAAWADVQQIFAEAPLPPLTIDERAEWSLAVAEFDADDMRTVGNLLGFEVR